MPNEQKKERKKLKRVTPEERAAIMADARTNRLTGKEVAAKHGISVATYYHWRRQTKMHDWYGVGRRVAWEESGSGRKGRLRQLSLEMIRGLIVQIVRQEVRAQLNTGRHRSKHTRGG